MLPRLVIPSYQRPQLIQSKTLKYLRLQEYPPDKILIFVASEEEKNLYERGVPSHLYGQIIVGQLGLKEQRNFISNYLDEDEIYISFDDDVDSLKLIPGYTFYDLIRDACDVIGSRQTGLVGILPNSDARRFKDSASTHLAHILGAFYICRNHRDILITRTVKEDYERSILYWLRYGSVYRSRRGGVQTKYLRGQGGISESNRNTREEEDVQYLTQTYPNLCRRKDKGDHPDLELNWRGGPNFTK
jgi:hypothetical protein